MIQRLSVRAALSLFIAIHIPTLAYSLGTEKAKASNDKSAVTGMLLFFGVCLVAAGAMTVKNKKYGPEEGLRNNYLRGEKAVIWGLAQLFFGVVLIVIGLISLML